MRLRSAAVQHGEMKILVVEEDALTVEALVAALTHQNYTVEVASDGQTGRELAEAFAYDLLLLDVTLPQLDGISLCQQLRSRGCRMPILLLTAHHNSHETAVGLDAGADDYVVKPFDPEELTARVRALLRRGVTATPPVLVWDKLQLDPSVCQVSYAHQLLPLTPKEYALLELFLRHPHRVFSCGMILEQLWKFEEIPSDEAVRTHIKGLRHKLKAVGEDHLVETVYGIGYRLQEPKPNVDRQATNGHRVSAAVAVSSEPIGQQPTTPIARPGEWQPTVERSSQERSSQDPSSTLAATSDRAVQSTLPIQARVMVVGDDHQLLALLQTLLTPWGLALSTLRDPQQFWATLETNAPDLLLLDLAMVASNGLALCQAVRHDPRWSGLPILCLTANTDANLVHQIFAAGADDFVRQPIIGPELVTRLLNCLERVTMLKKLKALRQPERGVAPA